jgi:DNA polymerase III subunit delta'
MLFYNFATHINFMQFEKIIGHRPVIQRFIQTVKNSRISHAQLMYGSEGIGKLKLAIAYAQYISCRQRTEDDSCGKCPSCIKYEKLIHPDLHFVYPVVKTKKFDKPVSDHFITEWRNFILNNQRHKLDIWLEFMGNENSQAGIFAQESSEILRKLNLKTFESEYKIMIIWLPEKMNPSSANKLLKMIEEPPMKTLFLLVSDFPEQIINTIQSRSQFIKIPKIDDDSLAEGLIKYYEIEKNKATEIARLANGNLNNALESLQADETEQYNFKMFTILMRLCYFAKIIELQNWIDEMSTIGRERQKNFLQYALKMIRGNYIMSTISENNINMIGLTKEELDFSSKFYTFIHQNNIQQLAYELNLAFKHIERNGTDRIVFLDLALKLTKLIRVKAA